MLLARGQRMALKDSVVTLTTTRLPAWHTRFQSDGRMLGASRRTLCSSRNGRSTWEPALAIVGFWRSTGRSLLLTTSLLIVQAMPARKRQLDVVFEPVMQSLAMRRLDRVLRAVAAKDVTLTFIGESGTGKEVLARRGHELSERRQGPFVPINCAAIPESLFESELFGHERGAFTGANELAKGKVAAAEHGTLFLDEIGEMPWSMQAKLLRFLENRRFMRVGGATKIEANVRLMFATLKPIEEEVHAGRFRADLFYRIQSISLHVPALRERRADIGPLLSQFIAQISSRHGVHPPRFSRSAKAQLLQYAWPGNVRELRNVVEAMCILREGRQVRVRDLPERICAQAPEIGSGVLSASPETLSLRLDDGLPSLTGQIIEAALSLENGDTAHAAQRLRISTRTVQRYVAAGRVRLPI
jgi:DNA-binding NtrC family response regulator